MVPDKEWGFEWFLKVRKSQNMIVRLYKGEWEFKWDLIDFFTKWVLI